MLKVTATILAMLANASASFSADEIVVEAAVLSHVEQVDVPAVEAGQLDQLLVREGEHVTSQQPVAQVEDREVRLAHQRTELEYAAAKALADDTSRIDAARKAAAKQRQMLTELEIELSVATQEAANNVAVRASEKAMEVARNEHQRAVRAREAYKNSVSDSEIDARRLAFERATLENEQASFEHSMKQLKLTGEEAAISTQKLAVEEADVTVHQAEELHAIAGLQAGLKRHDVEIAAVAVARRSVLSPIDGVVVELYRHAGEWVEPGEKVMRIIRLNRLRAEGFVPLAAGGHSLNGRTALIEVETPDSGLIVKEGRVSFVSPEVDPINQEVRVWAEFENEEPRLSPGMRARIRISGLADSKVNSAVRSTAVQKSN